MQNEIPAGSKVQVALTQKGVTTFHDAEVLAHMDGLVHVNLNGEAVSVDPSQIVTSDAPAAGTGSDSAWDEVKELSDVPPEVIAQLEKQMAILETVPGIEARVQTLETLPSYVSELHSKIDALEARVTALEAPKPIDAAAPAVQPSTTKEESTAPVVSAEPAGEGQATSAPEATAGATGE